MNATALQLDERARLIARLDESRRVTDELFQTVREEALYDRPIPERHRNVFYIGHLEAFDWNLIGGHALGLEPLHPEFDRLFAFGIDPVGGGLPTDQPADWPRLEAVRHYVRRVREQLDHLLAGPPAPAGRWQFPERMILNTAIEHRLMHAETLAYMFHQLPFARKLAPRDYGQPSIHSGPTTFPRIIDIPEGRATLGLPRNRRGFGWDNEFEAHSVRVPAFAIDAYKTTNADFLKFVLAGGYEERNFWSDADWAWIKEQNIRHPMFWREREGQWFYQGMFAEMPLPGDWPVYASHAEAAAYARFVGKSLPSEAQFQRAAYGCANGDEREYPWGDAAPDASRGNFNFERWEPTPVGSHPAGRSGFALDDAVGNGWEWTSTLFAPFAGFKPFPFYPGYSANFYDGKHYVMKGASPRTAACMLRRSFRNWFQPHYPFVYASFRCVNN